MISIEIVDETAPLEAVILGTPKSLGGTPLANEAFDPRSRASIEAGTYPAEKELIYEMEAAATVLHSYGVKVYRPELLENYNQVYARDIAFVIEDKMVVPSIIRERQREARGIQYLVDQVSEVLTPGDDVHLEGGDVTLWNGHLFVGYTADEAFDDYKVARTNEAGVEFLQKSFPNWKIKAFQQHKSDIDPRRNVLHLDCCFQPVGSNKAVIGASGFKDAADVESLVELFGSSNVLLLEDEEMCEMNSNFFSISPEVVLSDPSFVRLNNQLRAWGITVEEVLYQEVTKMGGLFRCSTLPLRRTYG